MIDFPSRPEEDDINFRINSSRNSLGHLTWADLGTILKTLANERKNIYYPGSTVWYHMNIEWYRWMLHESKPKLNDFPNIGYGGPQLSRQYQFGHGNINLATAISIWHGKINLATAISIWPRQFQFGHGNMLWESIQHGGEWTEQLLKVFCANCGFTISGHFVPWSDRSKSDRSNQ